MKKNMGPIDRAIRTVAAVVLIALTATGVISGTAAIAVTALAVIFLLTSLISFCPLYLPFGLSTLRKKLQSKTR